MVILQYHKPHANKEHTSKHFRTDLVKGRVTLISLNVLVAFLAFEVPHCTDDVMRSDASTRTGTKLKNTARVTAGLNLL